MQTTIPWNIELSKSSERLIVVALLLAFLAQGGAALFHMSATGDETHYLGMGRCLIKFQRWELADALLQPPLSYYLHSIPLMALSIDDRAFEIADINARGRAIMASYPDDRVLMLARLPILLLAAGLGFLVFLWAKEAYGSAGGLLALFLYAFHPIVIGNAVQITPDLCLSFFTVLTLFLYWRSRNSVSWRGSAAVGVSLGLALLSKYTAALVVLVLVFLVIFMPGIQRLRKAASVQGWRLRHLAVAFIAAIVIVNAGYLFHGTLSPLKGNSYRSRLFQKMEQTAIVRSIPIPFPRPYVLGLDVQHSVVEDGFVSYMLGEKAQRGWFSYYLVAFLLKSPIPFILLLVLTLVKGRDRLQWIILVAALVFPLYFSVTRLSRGVRYMLPSYPLLCIWLGQLSLSLKVPEFSRVMRWSFLSLLVWYAGESLYISPHFLAYFNQLGGGPNNGRSLLFESDFDWGQELKGMRNYLEVNKIDRIKFGYFSTADPGHYGIKYEPLPCEDPAKPQTGKIAVSATALQIWGCYDWLNSYKPIDKVGYTILIYDIPSGEGKAD